MLGRGLTSTCHNCRRNLVTSSQSQCSIIRRSPRSLVQSPSLVTRRYYANETSPQPEVPSVVEPNPDGEARVLAIRRKWGDNLPSGALSNDDFQLYKALYGPPIKYLNTEEAAEHLRSLEVPDDVHDGKSEEVEMVSTTRDGTVTVMVTANSQEEAEQYRRLRRDMQKAMEKSMSEEVEEQQQQHQGEEEEMYEEEDIGEDEEGEERYEEVEESDVSEHTPRYHPLTLMGKFATNPVTTFMPRELDESLQEVLKHSISKHIKERAKVLQPAVVRVRHSRVHGMVPLELCPENDKMNTTDAQVFVSGVFPMKYATSLALLTECRRKLGRDWVKGVKRVLDVGTGGASIMAWRHIVQAEKQAEDFDKKPDSEENTTESNTDSKSPSRKGRWWYEKEGTTESQEQHANGHGFHATVVASSYSLRSQLKKVLDSTTFIPRLPDSRHKDSKRDTDPNIKWEHESVTKELSKVSGYDLIIASDTLVSRMVEGQRMPHIQHLWSLLNHGGVLIIQEQGNKAGFKEIGYAREKLLKRIIKSPPTEGIRSLANHRILKSGDDVGMIIAPCTNHRQCPMYVNDEINVHARKDFCHFYQRWAGPGILKSVTDHTLSYYDTNYSYIAVRKGVDDIRPAAPSTNSTSVEHDIHREMVKRDQQKLDKLKDRQERKSEGDDAEGYNKIEKKIRQLTASMQETNEKYLAGRADEQVDLNKVDTTDRRAAALKSADQWAESTDEAATRQYMLAQPRIINPPIKATGHVILDLCTNKGTLERWTIPKSFSKIAYHDARKARWGDVWTLGAKTQIPRSARVGKDEVSKPAYGSKNKVKAKFKQKLQAHSSLEKEEGGGETETSLDQAQYSRESKGQRKKSQDSMGESEETKAKFDNVLQEEGQNSRGSHYKDGNKIKLPTARVATHGLKKKVSLLELGKMSRKS